MLFRSLFLQLPQSLDCLTCIFPLIVLEFRFRQSYRLRHQTLVVLALNNPKPQEFVAVNDSFGESGTPEQLMEKYKLNNQAIVEAVERVIKRK